MKQKIIQFKNKLGHSLRVRSRNVASTALAVRLVTAPLLPIASATLAEATTTDEPPLVTATLSIRTAPGQLKASVSEVKIEVGESVAEKKAREAREAEEARRQAEAAQKEAVARYVVSRYNPHRVNGGLTIDEARDMTVVYAQKYGVDPVLMSKIISCESGYNQFAKNAHSTASGYGQFLNGTWNSVVKALGWDPNTSQFDGERNIEATAYLMSVRGTSPWNASRSCWLYR